MDGDVEEDAKKMVKEVEARTKEGQRWMAGFRQGMERTSELEKGRSSIEKGEQNIPSRVCHASFQFSLHKRHPFDLSIVS